MYKELGLELVSQTQATSHGERKERWWSRRSYQLIPRGNTYGIHELYDEQFPLDPSMTTNSD